VPPPYSFRNARDGFECADLLERIQIALAGIFPGSVNSNDKMRFSYLAENFQFLVPVVLHLLGCLGIICSSCKTGRDRILFIYSALTFGPNLFKIVASSCHNLTYSLAETIKTIAFLFKAIWVFVEIKHVCLDAPPPAGCSRVASFRTAENCHGSA
jgi:hypothetical protein